MSTQRFTEEWLSAYNAARKSGRKSEPRQPVNASGGSKAAQSTLLQDTKGIRIDTGKRPKYGNRKTEVDGIRFQSRKEASRYSELRLLERAGKISDLRLQVKFSLDIEGFHVCNYYADFCYEENGEIIVEDSKGVRTKDYRIKAKLMMAIYRIKIKET